jgi:uncharacterized caspase-like protein
MRDRPALFTDRLCGLTPAVFLALLLGTLSLPAWAESRIALIIGNSEYTSGSLKLANPANDAAAMELALKDAGFQSIVKLNARRVDFYRAVDEFSARIMRDPHAIGLFYYAGHGVQADGVNYLIPVDAQIQSSAELEAYAFDVARVLRAMQAAQNEMNIVILDACRDNPLRTTRSAVRGLARLDAPSGTFIAYAAAPGQTAQEGALGANGVFTGELLKAMALPNLPLEQMFKRVITGVKAATHGSQTPWFEASIQGDFYFHPRTPGYAQAPDAPPSRPTAQASSPPASALGGRVGQKDAKCQSILERMQLGDPLDEQDRAYVKEKCN